VRGVADDYPVLAFDAPVAQVHARLWSALATRGTLIGAHDLLVAATAISGAHSVATLSPKELGRIRGLPVLVPGD
jgi:tRNA(fMet)-specific endonuclease VapC